MTKTEHRSVYMRRWYAQNREKMRAARLRWYYRNRERSAASHKQWTSKNREHCQAYRKKYMAQYYPKNRLRIIAQTKAYEKCHPEVKRKSALNFRLRHPERYRAIVKAANARRHARIRGANVHCPIVSKVIQRWRKERWFVCYYCSNRFPAKVLNIEHVVPIVRGGKHSADNICRSCPSCNNHKHTKFVDELNMPQPLLAI